LKGMTLSGQKIGLPQTVKPATFTAVQISRKTNAALLKAKV